MKSIITYILIAFVVFALAGFGYFFFVQQKGALTGSGVALTTTQQNQINFTKIFDRLSKFSWEKDKKLDLFKRASFISLIDYSVKIQRQDVGRTNPFGSLGSDTPAVQPTESPAQAATPTPSAPTGLQVDN